MTNDVTATLTHAHRRTHAPPVSRPSVPLRTRPPSPSHTSGKRGCRRERYWVACLTGAAELWRRSERRYRRATRVATGGVGGVGWVEEIVEERVEGSEWEGEWVGEWLASEGQWVTSEWRRRAQRWRA